MNDSMRYQLMSLGWPKKTNNITSVMAGIRTLMLDYGFEEKHIQRVYHNPDWRKDMKDFASHYHMHLTNEQYGHLQRLVDKLDALL